MNKEESLTFLQSCMDNVKKTKKKKKQKKKEFYRLDCVSPTESSDFEFVLPAIDLQCNCEINDEYDLDACDLVSNRTPKMQLNYSFLGTNLLNQQNNDNLPYAA